MVRDKYLVLVGIALMLVVGLGFVLAVHTSSPTTITVDVNQPYRYNITINNSDTGQDGNITFVNITIPSSFSFVDMNVSNGTTGNATLMNVGHRINLVWYNSTNGITLGNANNTNFWFNATAPAVGTYYINITTSNSTGITNHTTGITVNVVHGAPIVTLIYPKRNYNYSSPKVNFTVTSIDEAFNASACWVSLWGNFSNYSMHRVGDRFNWTNASMADGNYQANIWCNDTWGNINSTLSNINFTIDSTPPSQVNFTIMSLAQTSLSFNMSVLDATSGIISSCTVNRSTAWTLATVTGAGIVQNVTESDLACATGYIWNVTCTDAAGNQNLTSFTYTTLPCTASTTTHSSGGGSSTLTSQDLTNGYTKSVGIGDVITFRTTSTGANHNMVVLKVTATNATIQVASVPQKATLNIGEEKKFDINADNISDVSVKLNSIVAGKASFTMKSISEATTSGTTTTETGTELETGTAETEGTTSAGMSTTARTLMWVGITIAIVAVLYFIIRKFRKKGIEERILTGKKIR